MRADVVNCVLDRILAQRQDISRDQQVKVMYPANVSTVWRFCEVKMLVKILFQERYIWCCQRHKDMQEVRSTMEFVCLMGKILVWMK
jgi:hypothetical protein